MLGKFNVGIMGTGNIAAVMAETLNRMKGVKLYAVASREKVKADVFAGKHGVKKAYGSYEELVKDNKVELIYIATPHSEHYENARLCLENNKPVLCEKSFTANAAQAEELFKLAREKQVFITEAIWTRYMPMVKTIREVSGSGVIGDPKTLTANLGYVIDKVERILSPALAGGALLDVGVYPINFAMMIFGNNIEKVSSSCTYTDTGVDRQNTVTLQYGNGKYAVLNSSMESLSDRKGIIYGTKGFAIVENINNFESITVYDASYKKAAEYKRPKQISGYEYEVEASIRAIRAGKIQCEEMPHEEILRVMKLMDSLRKEWGIVYPFEQEDRA
ncbi:MAG: Gfo/Idh/MocA family oxidoreductase [Lachnospiraceae bacterium]|nr:Gfo/Idh/MocA family oxidoreductase [Lachnospiraceae bacterium]